MGDQHIQGGDYPLYSPILSNVMEECARVIYTHCVTLDPKIKETTQTIKCEWALTL